MIDLNSNRNAALGKATRATQANHTATAFRDPNAMDIDTSNLDEMFKGLSARDDIVKQHRRVMQGRCKVCDSKAQGHDPAHHQGTTCNWCGKKNHWAKVCLSHLCGEPRAQNIKSSDQSDGANIASTSTVPASSSSNDMEAQLAALRDMLDMQRKQMEQIADKVGKGF